MGLQGAIEWVQDQALSLPGIRRGAAPDYLEGKAGGKWPFWAAWPGPGKWEPGSSGMTKGLLSIRVEMHVAEKILPEAVKEAMKYVEAWPEKILADTTLGGNVSTFREITFDGLVAMKIGGDDTVGFRWLITDIKIQN